MSKYIDQDKLAEFARHSTIGIDANDIMRFPTADVVEVKHGEWLEDSGNIACSECHTIWLYRRTDFCPNCGADMRGETI